MQKCDGARAGGFVATEFQEWFRLRALPEIEKLARRNFVQYGHPEWFDWSVYADLCGSVGHIPSGINPFFLISLDSDPRHSMKHWWPCIDQHLPQRGQIPDRREIKAGLEGHIPIDKVKNYVPTAPKVPDAMQFAIESIFAPVKTRYGEIVKQFDPIRPRDMVWAIKQAFEEVATADNIRNCFRHCEENMRIFRGKEDETVTVGDTVYHCTHGNWLPKCRRG